MTTPTETTLHASQQLPSLPERPGAAPGRPTREGRLVRATLGACLALGCAISVGSCAPDVESAPVSSQAPRRRRPPPEPEGCVEAVLVEAPPACG